MPNPEPRDHSVLCALKDLKAIEADRVSEESRLAAEVERARVDAAERVAAEAARVRIAEETRRIESLRAEAAVLAARTKAAEVEAAREQRRTEQRLADQHDADVRLADDQRALRRLLGAEPTPPVRSWMWPATLAVVALALGGAGIAFSLRPATVVAAVRAPDLVPVAAPIPPVEAPTPPPPRFEVVVAPLKPKRPREPRKPVAQTNAATSVLKGLEACNDDPTCFLK